MRANLFTFYARVSARKLWILKALLFPLSILCCFSYCCIWAVIRLIESISKWWWIYWISNQQLFEIYQLFLGKTTTMHSFDLKFFHVTTEDKFNITSMMVLKFISLNFHHHFDGFVSCLLCCEQYIRSSTYLQNYCHLKMETPFCISLSPSLPFSVFDNFLAHVECFSQFKHKCSDNA